MPLTFSRRSACSAASRIARSCTTSNDRASSPISSRVCTGTGVIAFREASMGFGSARIRRTASGSRT